MTAISAAVRQALEDRSAISVACDFCESSNRMFSPVKLAAELRNHAIFVSSSGDCWKWSPQRAANGPAVLAPYGQAGENAMRFPHLAHRSAAAHKLHSTTAARQDEFDSGKSETINRLPALAYSSRKLSKEPEPSQSAQTPAIVGR